MSWGRLQRDYGANAVQFYDNNFFMREDHARRAGGSSHAARNELVV